MTLLHLFRDYHDKQPIDLVVMSLDGFVHSPMSDYCVEDFYRCEWLRPFLDWRVMWKHFVSLHNYKTVIKLRVFILPPA